MTDREIKNTYERNGYVVVKNFINDSDLNPIRGFIKARVDEYAHQQYIEDKLSSPYGDKSFGRRYADICEEQGLVTRGWGLGSFGREFYDLYNLPEILHVLSLILGPEVSSIGSAQIRPKLPGSVITSFPWHQDSQYIDQSKKGKKEKHTGCLHMITVWIPLVEATIENGCCWVIPGSQRWGLLDGARGKDSNVHMEVDVESRGTPVPVPLKPGGALFMSNLTVHSSKLNRTNECRWSIDFRYFPTSNRADLTAEQHQAAEFVRNKTRPHIVLSEGNKTTWEAWEASIPT